MIFFPEEFISLQHHLPRHGFKAHSKINSLSVDIISVCNTEEVKVVGT